MSFDWRTDDELPWDAPPAAQESEPSRPRSWPWLLAVALLGAVIAGLFYWQLSTRVEEATIKVEQDVRTAQSLVQTAAAQRDGELFYSFLSGRDPEWTRLLRELVNHGLLYDRSPLGLYVQDRPPDIIAVQLNPALNGADVISRHAYTVEIGNGLTETIFLDQTEIFRVGGNQTWLYSPPEPDFWGDRHSSRHRWLTLSYPGRDAEIGRRLAIDLDEKIGQLCATFRDLRCPAGLRVGVVLDSSPAAFLGLANGSVLRLGGLEMRLPAPTLVGLPADEPAYRAFYRGYAAQIVAAIVNSLVGWRCCDHTLFYRALLDRQAVQLGLRAWPVTTAHYEQAYLDGLTLESAAVWWNVPVTTTVQIEGAWQMYAVVEFLEQRFPAVGVVGMERLLAGSGGASFSSYLRQLAEANGTPLQDTPLPATAALSQDWRPFVYQRTLSAQQPRPLALPSAGIRVLCSRVSQPATRIFRFDSRTSNWSLELELGRPFARMSSVPGNDNLILQTQEAQPTGTLQSSFLLVNDGRITAAYEPQSQTNQWYYFGLADPSGRYLFLTSWSDYQVLDLEGCQSGLCELVHTVPGIVNWSPDGQNTLVSVHAAAAGQAADTLHLGDAAGQSLALVDRGGAPFWLGETSFGYIRPEPGAADAILVASLGGGGAAVILDTAAVRQALGSEVEGGLLRLIFVAVNPADPNVLLVSASFRRTANSAEGTRTYALLFDRRTGELAKTLTVSDPYTSAARFSPDGRWLYTSSFLAGVPNASRLLYLYDLTDGNNLTIHAGASFNTGEPDWSADGQWLLVQADADTFHLVAPAHHYIEPLYPPEPGCVSAAWGRPQ